MIRAPRGFPWGRPGIHPSRDNALTLPGPLMGREVLASSFADGVHFGSPCRLQWGLAPTRRPMAPEFRLQVEELHGVLRERMGRSGVALPSSPPLPNQKRIPP